jgi:deoxycytidylate deaminase
VLKDQDAGEHTAWLMAAAHAATHALCLRAKCGTIIVKDGEVIGEGYNAPPLDNEVFRTCLNEYDLPKNYRYDRTCCMHAEWRAILDAKERNAEKLKGSVLYFMRVSERRGANTRRQAVLHSLQQAGARCWCSHICPLA